MSTLFFQLFRVRFVFYKKNSFIKTPKNVIYLKLATNPFNNRLIELIFSRKLLKDLQNLPRIIQLRNEFKKKTIATSMIFFVVKKVDPIYSNFESCESFPVSCESISSTRYVYFVRKVVCGQSSVNLN